MGENVAPRPAPPARFPPVRRFDNIEENQRVLKHFVMKFDGVGLAKS
jgi:hypothetical protein